MADANERFYWGDFRLGQHGVEHVENPDRGTVQEFEGVDQKRRLVIANSANSGLELVVTVLLTTSSAPSRKAFRSALRATRVALEDRSLRQDPVVWVEDTTLSKAVGSYAAPVVTSVAHGRANGDVVLIRRAGAGLWTLATLSSVGADVFTVTAVTGGQVHAIAAADEIHLVEEYWTDMVMAAQPRVPPASGDHWGLLEYSFKGSGRFSYARTSASVGS